MNRSDSSFELAVVTCPSKNSSKRSTLSNNGSRMIASNKIMPQQIRKGYCLNSKQKSWTEVTATVRTLTLISNWVRHDWFQISRIKLRNSTGIWWRLYLLKPKTHSRTSRATDMEFHNLAMKPLKPRGLMEQRRTATITLPFKVSRRSAIAITRGPNKHCKTLQITFPRSRCHQIARRNSGRMHRSQSSKDHSTSRTALIIEVRICSWTTPKSLWKENQRISTTQKRQKVSLSRSARKNSDESHFWHRKKFEL